MSDVARTNLSLVDLLEIRRAQGHQAYLDAFKSSRYPESLIGFVDDAIDALGVDSQRDRADVSGLVTCERHIPSGSVCPKCSGSGARVYPSTTTWTGGRGGQTPTSDVCDQCWGSGNTDEPWANLREMAQEMASLRKEKRLHVDEGGRGMIVHVTIKDPDALFIAMNDEEEQMQSSIAKESPGLSAAEVKAIAKARRNEAEKRICDKFLEWKEYYVIEFDTDAGTARVVPNDEEIG